jgi:hypothetical protein
MRRLMLGTIALAALAAGPALAQRQCTSPADQAAFELQALRSELMVLATGCHENEQYNAFIRRYQADLQANEKAVSAYFQRRYGRAGQTEHDRFVTDMANALSRQGSSLGSEFCPRNGLMFKEVMALRSAADLAEYVAGKDLIPSTVVVCNEPAPVPAKKPALRTASK